MAVPFENAPDVTIVDVVIYRFTIRWALRAGLAVLPVVAFACSAPAVPHVVSDPDPTVKIPAIKASVAEHDMSVVDQLITDLESDDPAVRFYAINGLERLTGETFGYQYFVDEDQRATAIGKWKAWREGWRAARRQPEKK